MSNKIILSADSTCDLGEELKQKYNVEYFPYHIMLDGIDYLDNVNITADELFQAYFDRKVLPVTGAVNVDEYLNHFKKWVDEGFEVIHISLGHAISSSYQNCCIAAEELGHVYVVDSCNLSTGMGHLVIDAAEMIAAGMEAKEIAEKLRATTPRVHVSFVLDTLEFLHAGGRCSALAAFGANLFNLKPSIEVNNADGSMNVGKKYRGKLEKVIIDYACDQMKKYPNIDTRKLFITHSGMDHELYESVRDAVNEIVHFDNIYFTRASCTISSHCGPNCIGVLFETLPE